jgi:hypothetical protein
LRFAKYSFQDGYGKIVILKEKVSGAFSMLCIQRAGGMELIGQADVVVW